jgi:integrase
MPTAARSIHREHVEAFIAAEPGAHRAILSCDAVSALQQLFGWLDKEGEIDGSPMTKRHPKIPDKPVPVLPDEDVRRLLAACSGKDLRDQQDLAIIRLFLDTGMRLEGTAVQARTPES